MRRFSLEGGIDTLEERKLTAAYFSNPATPLMSTLLAPQGNVGDPLPDPQPPIPDPGDGPLIASPSLPPSGPAGPGS
jgi:hypothetical protein